MIGTLARSVCSIKAGGLVKPSLLKMSELEKRANNVWLGNFSSYCRLKTRASRYFMVYLCYSLGSYCVCSDMDMDDVEYVVKKAYNHRWTLKCTSCKANALISHLRRTMSFNDDYVNDYLEDIIKFECACDIADVCDGCFTAHIKTGDLNKLLIELGLGSGVK